jgi:phenylpropionate dioxygenase-like ring-hydroxylating dioxygenase large terminal subunit
MELPKEQDVTIFIEPEATDTSMAVVLLHQTFKTYPRFVSENSLDIMHIAFVHTFGNRIRPAPLFENPPKEIMSGHWRSSYVYESGKDSMVNRLFHLKRIDIENEFALPHTTIARIKFGKGLVSTVVTAACPINEGETKLFVKTYRNFFESNWFNGWFSHMMRETLNQDKTVIESIQSDGKFNMKYDKLQNVYRTLYNKYIHPKN